MSNVLYDIKYKDYLLSVNLISASIAINRNSVSLYNHFHIEFFNFLTFNIPYVALRYGK